MAIESPMNRLFSSAGQAKAPTGTGYTNLNRFMQANQGNKLGEKVAGNVQSQIGGVKAQLGEQKTAFEKEAEQKRLDSEANKNERDAIVGRFSDPSTQGGELSEQDVAKFNQFRGGQYAGPSGLKDTQALSSQAGEIRGQTANLTPSGTQELLRRTVGGDRYTQGQQRLDSLLMDRSGLKQVGREAAALGTDISRANLAAQGQAQQLAGQAQQFGAQTTDALTGALGGLDAASQAQLATAQAAEQDRLARINAIQDFAQNKVAKRDAQGKVILDQYGNPTYDTSAASPRGSSDTFAQMDNLRNLLNAQGVQKEEIDKLLGNQSFNQSKSAYDQELERIKKQQRSQVAYEMLDNTIMNSLVNQGYGVANPNYDANNLYYGAGTNAPLSFDKEKYKRDLESGNLDLNSININIPDTYNDGGTVAGGSFNLGKRVDEQYNAYNPYYTGMRTAAENKLYEPLGYAGEAIRGGNVDTFYDSLSKSLSANSKAAEGLTEQGVASDSVRKNYTALEKLLGKGSDLSKYKESDTKYQAGNLLLNPDLIRRTF